MKIAVINETSAADRNSDIVAALEGRGHEIINAGMKKNFEKPELQYYNTALLAALLLNLKKVDFVVGGCGTGQGFMMAVTMYPGIFCGHILNDLDAWLFAQINNGNCISLMLNQGYGWAANINLQFIFDRLFSAPWGAGYPPHRAEPQQASRKMLERVSQVTHKSMSDILQTLPDEVILPVLDYPGVKELLDIPSIQDGAIQSALLARSK